VNLEHKYIYIEYYGLCCVLSYLTYKYVYLLKSDQQS